jgi:hypothetical protein
VAVFYSFHYDRDAARVQQIMNMGVIESQQLLSSQQWEHVRRQGRAAIKDWIEKHVRYKTAVVVLVGAETASREWVNYEITKGWNDKRGLVGIRINGLAPLGLSQDRPGANPFTNVRLDGGRTVADDARLHRPSGTTSKEIYASIQANLTTWVDNAYKRP